MATPDIASANRIATPETDRPRQPHSAHRLPFDADLLAIAIGLALAALIRFGIIHQVAF